jgi:hypothetical protein
VSSFWAAVPGAPLGEIRRLSKLGRAMLFGDVLGSAVTAKDDARVSYDGERRGGVVFLE